MKRLQSIFLVMTGAAVPGWVAADDWTGFYGGLTLGYADHSAKHSIQSGSVTGDSKPNGAVAGAFLGYGFDLGGAVLAAEFDIEANAASGSHVRLAPVPPAQSGGSAEGKWQGSLRATLGFPGKLGSYPALFFATAGWATGEFNFEGGPPNDFSGNGFSDRLEGWTAGVGVDTQMPGGWALRAEYRYTDFGETLGTVAPRYGFGMPMSVDQHAVRVGFRKNF